MHSLFLWHIDLADRILNHFINLPGAILKRWLFRLLMTAGTLFAEQHFQNFYKNIPRNEKQYKPKQCYDRLFCCAAARTGTPACGNDFLPELSCSR